MKLNFELSEAKNYKSKSQIVRVLSENWVKNNSYCPNCGEVNLTEFENNKPVADFYCKGCLEQFELKSKCGANIGKSIVDGAYSTMIERINSDENPNFFLLTYDKENLKVNNFLIIPKYYFTPDIVVKRKPLSSSAVRSGWVGCNINITKIPETGMVFLVKEQHVVPKETVKSKWRKTEFLRQKSGESKSWILDVMSCIDKIEKETFVLKDIYAFEQHLKEKHPKNHFIKEKIRQQLQVLRDNDLVDFKGNGKYKRISQ